MKIKRAELIDKLYSFAQQGSGLVIGIPGVGKSHSVALLSKKLWDENIPSFIIQVDRIDADDESIKSKLGTEQDWPTFLNEVAIPEGRKGVLIFDGYDAARDESKRDGFYKLIQTALNRLNNWNVIVTCRSYDASKSLKLIRLFHGNQGLGFERLKTSRHFAIQKLSLAELDLALNDNGYQEISTQIPHELKDILRTPFFLLLFNRILQGQNGISDLKVIKTEVELLEFFWELKVTSTQDDLSTEALLQRVVEVMVTSKKLTIEKLKHLRGDIKEFNYLLSENILEQSGVHQSSLGFSHNILFDYAVSRYTIPTDVVELKQFLSEDKSQQFFLRPSFLFTFTSLWYHDREAFWTVTKSISGEEFTLFNRLILTAIISTEYEDAQEVLRNWNQDVDFMMALLQAIRFHQHSKRRAKVNLNLLYELSGQLRWEVLWEVSAVFDCVLSESLDEWKGSEPELYRQCGVISRNFLEFILNEQINNPSISRLGGTKGVEFVAKTYTYDIKSSRRVMDRVLSLLDQPDFEIWYFTSLSDDIHFFIENDPEYVSTIYERIMLHEEKSAAETSMSAGVVLNLRSNRKQDFGMCYYRLLENYAAFLRSSPLEAVKTGITIINTYASENKVLKPQKWQILIDGVDRVFKDELSQFDFDEDRLSYRGHSPLELSVKIFNYFDDLIKHGENETLARVIEVYVEKIETSYLWNKLIVFLAGRQKHKQFKSLIYDLLRSDVLLTHPHTIHEIGQLLEKSAKVFNEAEIIEIEKTIHHIPNGASDTVIRKKVRLIGCIPREFIQLKESRELLEGNERVSNEPLYQFSTSSSPFTDEMWLEEKGVDLSVPDNSKVIESIHALKEFGTSGNENQEFAKEFGTYLNHAKKLFSCAKDNPSSLHKDLLHKVLYALAKFTSGCIEFANELTQLDYDFVKSILIYVMMYKSEYDESNRIESSAYSPTPKTEGSTHLCRLYAHRPDKDILGLIDQAIIDDNPRVRQIMAMNLGSIWHSNKEIFWERASKMALNENDLHVLTPILRLFQYEDIESYDNETTKKIVERAFEFLVDDKGTDNFYRMLVSVILNLLNRYDDKLYSELIRANLENHSFCRTLLFTMFDYLDPKHYNSQWEKLRTVESKLSPILTEIVENQFKVLRELDLKKPENKDDAENCLNILDLFVQQVYFKLDLEERKSRQKGTEPIGDEERLLFFEFVKPNLVAIIKQSKNIGDGLILGHTAYYLLQALNGVLRFNPEDARFVLNSSRHVIELSYAQGITLDSMSVKEMVSMTELLLADHRGLLKEQDCLDDLVTILNLYVKAGWPEAMEFLWRLEDIYK